MENKLYTVKITNAPLSQNIGIEKSFYTDNIEETMKSYLRNRHPAKWEVIGVTDVDSMVEFDKNNF